MNDENCERKSSTMMYKVKPLSKAKRLLNGKRWRPGKPPPCPVLNTFEGGGEGWKLGEYSSGALNRSNGFQCSK